jgi:hypothetical protein
MLGTSRAPTEQTTPDVINAQLGRNAIARRRKPLDSNVEEVYKVTASDERQWETAMDEPLFQYRKHHAGVGLDANVMEVLPSLDGLNPDTVWSEVRYAGLSVQSVPFKPNKKIAVKQSGKGRILNTGMESIRAGEHVELYAMRDDEAKRWKSTDPRKRLMAGTRSSRHGKRYITQRFDLFSNSPATKKITASERTIFQSIPTMPSTDFEKIVNAIDKFRSEHQPATIGIALQTAAPRQMFEVLLSQTVPG